MYRSNALRDHFADRLRKGLLLLVEYGIVFERVGIFGSYARDDFVSGSDIDLCVIVKEHPDRFKSGTLREEADLLGIDVVYMTSEYFETDQSPFTKNVRRD